MYLIGGPTAYASAGKSCRIPPKAAGGLYAEGRQPLHREEARSKESRDVRGSYNAEQSGELRCSDSPRGLKESGIDFVAT